MDMSEFRMELVIWASCTHLPSNRPSLQPYFVAQIDVSAWMNVACQNADLHCIFLLQITQYIGLNIFHVPPAPSCFNLELVNIAPNVFYFRVWILIFIIFKEVLETQERDVTK